MQLQAGLDRDGAVQPRLLGAEDAARQEILLGVIDLNDMSVETPATVAGRIRRALPYVRAEDIIVAPDCGMKYLPREVAFGKLCAMVEGAKRSCARSWRGSGLTASDRAEGKTRVSGPKITYPRPGILAYHVRALSIEGAVMRRRGGGAGCGAGGLILARSAPGGPGSPSSPTTWRRPSSGLVGTGGSKAEASAILRWKVHPSGSESYGPEVRNRRRWSAARRARPGSDAHPPKPTCPPKPRRRRGGGGGHPRKRRSALHSLTSVREGNGRKVPRRLKSAADDAWLFES